MWVISEKSNYYSFDLVIFQFSGKFMGENEITDVTHDYLFIQFNGSIVYLSQFLIHLVKHWISECNSGSNSETHFSITIESLEICH